MGDGLGPGQCQWLGHWVWGRGSAEEREADRSVSIPQDEASIWGPRTRGNKGRGAGVGPGVGSQLWPQMYSKSSLWEASFVVARRPWFLPSTSTTEQEWRDRAWWQGPQGAFLNTCSRAVFHQPGCHASVVASTVPAMIYLCARVPAGGEALGATAMHLVFSRSTTRTHDGNSGKAND